MTTKKLKAIRDRVYNNALPRHLNAAAASLACQFAADVEGYLKKGDLDMALAAIRNAASCEKRVWEAA